MSDPIVVEVEPEVIGVEVTSHSITVQTTPPPVITVEVEAQAVTVEVAQAGPIVVESAAVGVAGPAGPPGEGVPEIYIQPTQPAEGTTAWYWFETDGAGNLTGNEYAYDADGI